MNEDFLKRINHLESAWVGHGDFAIELVKKLKPQVTVDLGVDWGFSTFCFAYPNIGHVYGVDWFQGDAHTRFRNTEEFVRDLHEKLSEDFGMKNLTIINSDFNELAKTWDKKIDILHIDGFHEYNAVKNDFDTWIEFCHEDSVVLFHDTYSFINDVGKFFEELDGYKLNKPDSAGLGIYTRSKKTFDMINEIYPEIYK